MDSRTYVEKLDGTNYNIWKFKTELILIKEGIWNVIKNERPENPDEKWLANDDKARATIGLLLENDQLLHIRNASSAKESWEVLKDYYEKPSLTNKIFLYKKLFRTTMPENSDLKKHLNSITEIVQQLAALGKKLEDDLIVACILFSLPASYESLVMGLEARPDEDLTVEYVKGKLLSECNRRQEFNGGVTGDSALKVKNFNKKISCHHCKKFGHLKRDCYFLKKNKGQNGQYTANVTQDNGSEDNGSYNDLCFGIGSEIQDNKWYVDSGATSHMTHTRRNFSNFISMDESVCLANGSRTKTKGKGDCVLLCSQKNGNTTKITLKDVLYVPDLEANLVSVKKIACHGQNFVVKFQGHICEMSKNDNVFATARLQLKSNLYAIDTQAEKVYNISSDTCTSECIHKWHRRLGHRDPEAIRTLLDKGLATGMSIKQCKVKTTCDICIKGKMSKLPFPKISKSQTTDILEIVHSDVCGPMENPTPGGKRYILTLIDDFSRYTNIFLLEKKSEVTQKIVEFVRFVKNKFGKKPKAIRSDRGGEYMNRELQQFLKEEGIKSQTSAPYCPQQNGVAERKNRSLCEMALCMILDADLHKRFWGEAVNTACYLQNRLPTRATGKTPYELWNKSIPDLKHIRTFGSVAYALIDKDLRMKFDQKAVKLILVGYEEGSKAYRLLNKQTNRITISRDVKFVENDHLCKEKVDENVKKDQKYSNTKQVSKSGVIEVQLIPNDIETKREARNENPASDPNIIEYFDVLQQEEVDASITEDSLDASRNTSSSSLSDSDIATTSDESNFFGFTEEAGPRRSTRINKGIPPEKFVAGLVSTEFQEPASYNEAIKSKNSSKWKEAMDDEINSMYERQTWELQPLPAGKNPVGSKWLFKIKTDASGNLVKFKARIVAQGYSQKYGEDFYEVYAPVVKLTSVRLLLSLAGKENLIVRQYDVKTAFLNGELEEEIFMKQPEGYIKPGQENLYCRLKKSIYGLKQAARAWNTKLNSILEKLEFRRGIGDKCLYSKKENEFWIYILIYVDDILIACKEEEIIKKYADSIGTEVQLNSLGDVKYFLGIETRKNEKGIYCINQKGYIEKILKRFKLQNAKFSKIPMDPGYYKNSTANDLENNELYRKAIGALLYLSVNTRPDIAASISILGRKVTNPNKGDWNEIKRVFKYLNGTKNYELKLGEESQLQNCSLVGYADADWGANQADRKSNSGFLFKIFGATICWVSRKQTCVSLSSTEAEYISLAEACQEAIWLKQLLQDFNIQETEILIYEDNQSCIKLLQNEKSSNRSKHIDTKYHFIRDLFVKKIISVEYCPTENMIADVLTKPLAGTKIKKFAELIGLTEKNLN